MKLLQWDFDAWEDYLYWQVENKYQTFLSK